MNFKLNPIILLTAACLVNCSPVNLERRNQVASFDNSNVKIDLNKSLNIAENEAGNRVTVRNLERRGQSFAVSNHKETELDRSINTYEANYGVIKPVTAASAASTAPDTTLKARRNQNFVLTTNQFNKIDQSLNEVNANFGGGNVFKSKNFINNTACPNKKNHKDQKTSIYHSNSSISYNYSTNLQMNKESNS
ncbi:hypothetical protein CONCODRAFT_72822 [Conidiobolus coronatus NRRL 28638]|uniref:Lipoprotein n=1 Tax=Conidiobolus coronatus (strain ATCC 28846 / CBS 209.66 / NRRL 28638) TaxID=796925 RepID=A0A137NYA7_CONC2|nr:hypothetical protein CONCODRAFT_72822 [Conidiobolus coronatus NRRL 28638]|eukprot:KXN67651.1 hypothetical protein CONCODRAFT_72822 [Conidiobolus coronatus NRRL 28638]